MLTCIVWRGRRRYCMKAALHLSTMSHSLCEHFTLRNTHHLSSFHEKLAEKSAEKSSVSFLFFDTDRDRSTFREPWKPTEPLFSFQFHPITLYVRLHAFFCAFYVLERIYLILVEDLSLWRWTGIFSDILPLETKLLEIHMGFGLGAEQVSGILFIHTKRLETNIGFVLERRKCFSHVSGTS